MAATTASLPFHVTVQQNLKIRIFKNIFSLTYMMLNMDWPGQISQHDVPDQYLIKIGQSFMALKIKMSYNSLALVFKINIFAFLT
jgi:hypothetical protein